MRFDRPEAHAQISVQDPAFRGSYRSDDLCATAACEPHPYRAIGATCGSSQTGSVGGGGLGTEARTRGVPFDSDGDGV